MDMAQKKIKSDSVRHKSAVQYRSLFENNKMIMLLLDPSGGAIIDANHAAADFYGYSRDRLKTMNIAEIISSSADGIGLHMRTAESGGEHHARFRHRLSGGEVREVEEYTSSITLNGKPLLFSIVKDVTGGGRAGKIRNRPQDFLLPLFETFPGMIWRSDRDGGINYVNKTLLEFTGGTTEKLLGKGWLDIVHPDDRESTEEIQYKYIEQRRPFQMEYRVRHVSGEYRWIIDAGKPYEDAYGEYAGYIGTCLDVSRRIIFEERMNHLNRLYSVISKVSQAIVKINLREALLREVCKITVEQGKFAMAAIGMQLPDENTIRFVASWNDNEAPYDLRSFTVSQNDEEPTPERVVVATDRSYIANNVKTDQYMSAHREELLKRGLKSVAAFPIRFPESKTGVFIVYSYEENFFTEQEIQLLGDIAEEISFAVQKIADEQKRLETERSLHTSEERFRMLVQSMDDIVYVLDRNQRYIGVYGKWLERFGLQSGMFIGKSAGNIFTPEAAHIHEEANKRALEGEHVLFTWLAVMPGGNRTIQTSLSPVRDNNGMITGIVGVGRDVTELREVQELQRLQSAALESAANAVIITDTEGIIQSVNKAFTELTGYQKDEVIGKKTNILRSGKHDTPFYKNLWDTVRAGRVWSGEMINRRKDGTLYTEEMTVTPVYDSSGTITNFIAIKQDITHQKQLQNHLIQAQKMEGIGTLASGIAHDFNNILGIIVGYTSLIEKHSGNREKLIRGIEAINKAAHRGANLVQQILTFARKTDVTMSIVQVNNVITDLVRMLEDTFPKTITINMKLGQNIPALITNHSQIQQALLNLCVNARDAIQSSDKNEGTITVKTTVIPGPRLKTNYPDARSDKYISISVSDNGIGISEEVIGRVFEPFFTTKEKGKGTGLGLSVVYGIVNSYQGFVDIDSSPNAGTTVTVYLPVWPVSKDTGDHTSVGENHPVGGNETILLIEDESLLVDAIRMLLEDKGYNLLIARDGQTGIEFYHENRNTIDIVISDIGLPKIDGTEVYRQIKNINPGVKFILASGHIEPATKSEMADAGVNAFIRKPYSPEEILFAIRSVLESD
jgi:two-component system, cell cycle sensor histidine kinase and response regulator CckA